MDIVGLDVTEAYIQGYYSRSDRQELFSCNKPVEYLLTLEPERVMQELNSLFPKYKGKYELRIV